MMERRLFIAGMAGGLGGSLLLPAAVDSAPRSPQKVTILHTNDTHSRIDPFAHGKFKGMGGVARRAALITALRKKHPQTLVVDAGDLFQGTPYFNLFRGQIEMKALSMSGYDLAAIGNHEFDLGADQFLKMAHTHARFPFLAANYSFQQALASKVVKPYAIKVVSGWRIGFFGLGLRFRGMVASKLHKGVSYSDPVAAAKKWAKELRTTHKCDAVVLLSHLGLTGFDGEAGDVDIAKKVSGIDVIIGGHTHTFLHKPKTILSPNKRQTHIFQVGHSGVLLGQIDLHFAPHQKVKVRNAVHPIKP